jgi:hypothetical protein
MSQNFRVDRTVFYRLVQEYKERQELIFSHLSTNDPTFTHDQNRYYIFESWMITDDGYSVYANNKASKETITYAVQKGLRYTIIDDFYIWVDFKLRYGYLSLAQFENYFIELGLFTQFAKMVSRHDAQYHETDPQMIIFKNPEQ